MFGINIILAVIFEIAAFFSGLQKAWSSNSFDNGLFESNHKTINNRVTLTLNSCSNPVAHAYHTSITQLEYNAKLKIYECSIRTFTDDLEKAIGLATKNPKLKIVNGDKTDTLIWQYITKHFSIKKADGTLAKFEYLGKENEDIATWIYLEIPADAIKTGHIITYSLLTEVFDDQVNIFNIINQGQKKTLMFDSSKKVLTL